MVNNFQIDKNVRDNCYNFLENPVIVTSGGSMTPFFLNGEGLMQDGSEYKQFSMNPLDMTTYAIQRYQESNVFKHAIDHAAEIISKENFNIISGGRTRDWPFAAVIAQELGLPFLALFKDIDTGHKPQIILEDTTGIMSFDVDDITNAKVGHVVDLVTTASSVTKDTWGWIPQIRGLGADITDVYAFIDRNQGARENIGELGVDLTSFCSITPEWLNRYDASNTKVVANYLKNPLQWTINHLQKNGLKALNQYVDGSWDKDDRFLKFMTQNQDALGKAGLWERIINTTNSIGTYQTHDGKYPNDLLGAIDDFNK